MRLTMARPSPLPRFFVEKLARRARRGLRRRCPGRRRPRPRARPRRAASTSLEISTVPLRVRGLDGVVEQVDEHALDLVRRRAAAAAAMAPGACAASTSPIAAVVERQRLVDDVVDRRRLEAGRRQARELRELVHQVLERLDLAARWRRCESTMIFSMSGAPFRYALRMRCAESWIGVSGFLISCASLRATSPQAATFCARIKRRQVVEHHEGARRRARRARQPHHGDRQLLVDAGRRSAGRRKRDLALLAADAAGKHAVHHLDDAAARADHRVEPPARHGEVQVEEAAGRRVPAGERAVGVDHQHAGADGLEHRLHERAPLLQLLVLAHQARARVVHFLLAAREALGHAVEGGDEARELLVGGDEVDAHAALAAGDAFGALGYQADRGGDAPRQVVGQPHRAENEQQAGESVEEQVERLDRRLERLGRAELRVALFHLTRVVRHLARQHREAEDHRADLAVGAADWRGGAQGFAVGQRDGGVGGGAGKGCRDLRRLRGPPAAATATAAGSSPQSSPSVVNTLNPSSRSSSARDSTRARSRSRGRAAHAPRRSRAPQPRAAPAAFGDRLAQAGGEALRRREQPLDVHVEPAIDRLLDDVAAHGDQDHRWPHRHQQEHEREPHAEAGARACRAGVPSRSERRCAPGSRPGSAAASG